jgi:hypothetical protein
MMPWIGKNKLVDNTFTLSCAKGAHRAFHRFIEEPGDPPAVTFIPKLPRAIKIALPFALVAIAAPMVAQMPEAPGKADKSRVVAGTYTADAGHSLVAWNVNHFGFNDYFGLFGDITGTLDIDPANPAAAKVSVKFLYPKCLRPAQDLMPISSSLRLKANLPISSALRLLTPHSFPPASLRLQMVCQPLSMAI